MPACRDILCSDYTQNFDYISNTHARDKKAEVLRAELRSSEVLGLVFKGDVCLLGAEVYKVPPPSHL